MADDEVVQMARERLAQDLPELRTQQGQRVPELNRPMKDINVERPEKEALFLPSDYSATVHDELKLGALTQVEYQLRELNAYQALDTGLQPLFREHLQGKDGKAPAAGQVKESDPWFWRVGRPSTLSEEDKKNWNQELDRVKCFRLRALLERAKEERDILDEEFDRAWQSFLRTAASGSQ
ncbi:hypothetical protein B0H13DRAFT_1876855 [Mycena leptocephala]|nr:hypothetical protein B0H13DRAFT_1876855 [Mycena leptocephala]